MSIKYQLFPSLLSRGKEITSNISRPAIFLDRDGTIVEYIDLLSNIDDLLLYPFSHEAIAEINKSDYLAIVITNQPVVAMNLCDIYTVEKIHNKMEQLLRNRGSYLDALFFCPHHPDRFSYNGNPIYNKECECRKPAVGMIEQAKFIYNINMDKSWIIGDTTRDIQTGINAGLKTILVKTGKAGKDKKYNAEPDFIFDNVKEAVHFIVQK